MKYAIIIEKGKRNYSAYVPDLPGCVTVGDTLEEVKRMMQEAIGFHIEELKLHGDPVPPSTSECCYVDVDVSEIKKRLRKSKSAAQR